jgi:hypothetical protein
MSVLAFSLHCFEVAVDAIVFAVLKVTEEAVLGDPGRAALTCLTFVPNELETFGVTFDTEVLFVVHTVA